ASATIGNASAMKNDESRSLARGKPASATHGNATSGTRLQPSNERARAASTPTPPTTKSGASESTAASTTAAALTQPPPRPSNVASIVAPTPAHLGAVPTHVEQIPVLPRRERRGAAREMRPLQCGGQLAGCSRRRR